MRVRQVYPVEPSLTVVSVRGDLGGANLLLPVGGAAYRMLLYTVTLFHELEGEYCA